MQSAPKSLLKLFAIILAFGACTKDPVEAPKPITVTEAPDQIESDPLSDVEANLNRLSDETVLPLSPGEYRWHPEVSPSGPVVIPDKLAKVYRNGIRIDIHCLDIEPEQIL